MAQFLFAQLAANNATITARRSLTITPFLPRQRVTEPDICPGMALLSLIPLIPAHYRREMATRWVHIVKPHHYVLRMVISVNPCLCARGKVSDSMRRCVEVGEWLFVCSSRAHLLAPHPTGFPSSQEPPASPGERRMWPGWQMKVWEPVGVPVVRT